MGLQYGLEALSNLKNEKSSFIDYYRQEFLIAAAFSNDPEIKTAYFTGDPYLAFAKPAGAVPLNATKSIHKAARELFKALVLGVRYGMQIIWLCV